MLKRFPVIQVTILLICILQPLASYAHGVEITHQTLGKNIEIACRYDDGTVLARATVDIFSPNDPATPKVSGLTDSNGLYVFTPDRSQPGEWTVRVRFDGHGGLARILVEKLPFFTMEHFLQLALALAATGFAFSALRFLRSKDTHTTA